LQTKLLANESTGYDNYLTLLAKTSGNMGMKQGKDFAMFGGKPVSLKEKAQLEEKKAMKEKEKK